MFDILSTDVLDLDELRLEHNETELPLKSFKLTSKGSLYTSVMTGAEIVLRGEHDLKGEWLKPLRYIANRQVNNGQVKVVEYELQGVVESEYDLGKDETKLVTYDRMIHFQRPYDGSFTETTVGDLLESFGDKHDLEVDFIKNVSDVAIEKDFWETDLSYTDRDILNDIAEFTQSTIGIRNNKLTVFDVIDTGFEIITAESVVFKGEYQANIVNISYEPQHDNHYAPEGVLIEGSPDYIPLEERTELMFENNPIMLENAQQHALDVLEAVRHLKYETGEFRVAHLGVFYVGDKVLINGKEIVITEQVYDTGNVMVDLVSDRPNGYREQYLVETDQKRQGQETSLVVDKLNGTITATVNRVEDLGDELSEQASLITQTENKIETEITERVQQGEELESLVGSKITQTVEDWTALFTRLEQDQDLTNDEIELIQTYFRISADGIILGKSDSPIEFFAENDIVGFRENGEVIAYWQEGTMHVENLIAIMTIVIGHHQIEKYDSPVAGKTSVVRMADE